MKGDVCTQTYVLQMNSLSNTEITLTIEQRSGQNETSNSRHSENQDCTKSYTEKL